MKPKSSNKRPRRGTSFLKLEKSNLLGLQQIVKETAIKVSRDMDARKDVKVKRLLTQNT